MSYRIEADVLNSPSETVMKMSLVSGLFGSTALERKTLQITQKSHTNVKYCTKDLMCIFKNIFAWFCIRHAHSATQTGRYPCTKFQEIYTQLVCAIFTFHDSDYLHSTMPKQYKGRNSLVKAEQLKNSAG